MRSSRILPWIVPFLFILIAAHAVAVPPLPAEFYGSALMDGQPAPAGTVITAQIHGLDRGSITIETPGFYGGPGLFDPRLKVNVSEEEYKPGEMSVVFFIDGQQAAQSAIFEAGSSRQFDISTGPGQSPVQPVQQAVPSGSLPVYTSGPSEVSSSDSSDSSDTSPPTIRYGLDQPRVFSSDDGLAEISFTKDTMLFSPEGQFLNAMEIQSTNIADLPSPAMDPGLRFSGYAYEIIPSGTYFNPNGTLTLKLPPERAYEIINAGPVIYEYLPQNSVWEPVPTHANVFTNIITADIFEAGIFGLYLPGSTETGDNSVLSSQPVVTPVSSDNFSTSPAPVQPLLPGEMIPVITPQEMTDPSGQIPPGMPGIPPSSIQDGQTPAESLPVITETPAVSPEGSGDQAGIISNPFTGMATRIAATIKGPILTMLSILALVICANIAVYSVYRLWWLRRN